jgi:hypothetical protein
VVVSAVQAFAVVQSLAAMHAAALVLQVEAAVVALVAFVVVVQTVAARFVAAFVVVVQAFASVAFEAATVWTLDALMRVMQPLAAV